MRRLLSVRFDPATLQPLSAEEIRRMTDGGRVLAARRDGAPKVVLTRDGDVVKRISPEPCGGIFDRTPRALRFARHAERLAALGVPVPEVRGVHRLVDGPDHVLVYRPLEGDTLRAAGGSRERARETSALLATALARLHDLGVVFRAGHLGNYIVLPDGRVGLIDVHALSIVRGSVSVVRRARSFRILLKNPCDRAIVAADGGVRGFLARYRATTRLDPVRSASMTALVRAMHPAARASWQGSE